MELGVFLDKILVITWGWIILVFPCPFIPNKEYNKESQQPTYLMFMSIVTTLVSLVTIDILKVEMF